jgi:hypothetical protein
MRRLVSSAAVLAAVTLGAPSAPAQSAKDVINDMMARYEKRMAGVQNYTVVQEAMGFNMTMYFEKETVNGRPVFKLRQTTVAGRTTSSRADDDDFDLYSELPRLADHATYEGRETVDGQATHVITMDNLEDVRFGRGMVPQNADFKPKRATVYVDTKLAVPRRMILEGQMRMQDRNADVTATVDLLDYRDVQGMLHPFHTVMQIEGIGQAMDPEQRKQYEEMKKQLAEMPESQRQMVEKMMKGRLEQMEKMMGDDGTMNVEMIVQELQVNQGAPK